MSKSFAFKSVVKTHIVRDAKLSFDRTSIPSPLKLLFNQTSLLKLCKLSFDRTSPLSPWELSFDRIQFAKMRELHPPCNVLCETSSDYSSPRAALLGKGY